LRSPGRDRVDVVLTGFSRYLSLSLAGPTRLAVPHRPGVVRAAPTHIRHLPDPAALGFNDPLRWAADGPHPHSDKQRLVAHTADRAQKRRTFSRKRGRSTCWPTFGSCTVLRRTRLRREQARVVAEVVELGLLGCSARGSEIIG
jgi:hypothetical protein